MKPDALYRIDENELQKAAATLIDAFSDDPIAKKLNLSQRTISQMYETPLKIGLCYGEVHATSDRYEGVMVFCPDEKANLNLWDMIGKRMLLSSLGLIRLLANSDMRRLYGTLETDRKNLKIGPYYYLMAIGVLRDHQGKGYGGQMLRYLCQRAESETKAIYLETQTGANVQWYEKFGFEVVKEIFINS